MKPHCRALPTPTHDTCTAVHLSIHRPKDGRYPLTKNSFYDTADAFQIKSDLIDSKMFISAILTLPMALATKV